MSFWTLVAILSTVFSFKSSLIGLSFCFVLKMEVNSASFFKRVAKLTPYCWHQQVGFFKDRLYILVKPMVNNGNHHNK